MIYRRKQKITQSSHIISQHKSGFDSGDCSGSGGATATSGLAAPRGVIGRGMGGGPTCSRLGGGGGPE